MRVPPLRVCRLIGVLVLTLGLLSPASAQLPLQDGYAVATYFSDAILAPGSFRVAVFDTNDSAMTLGPCNSPVTFFHTANNAPPWDAANLGSVFGVALDSKRNIFVCATTIYGGMCSGYTVPSGATYGTIYRIEGGISSFAGRGTISIFANLPNGGQGLGNICFDRVKNQFFVTDMDDGLIYRLKNVANPVPTTYNHGLQLSTPFADVPSDGYTDHKRRVWAVAIHKRRLFYSTWRNDRGFNMLTGSTAANEIWSVEIGADGDFKPLTARIEIVLPKYTDKLGVAYNWSMPVSDISFAPLGERILLAERSIKNDCTFGSHESRLLEYCFRLNPDGTYEWHPCDVKTFQVGENNNCAWSGLDHTNSCGGTSVDIQGRPWVSGDALNYYAPSALCTGALCGLTYPYIYGYQRFPANGNATALPVTSTSNLVDIDENPNIGGNPTTGGVKSFPGGIRVYNAPCFNYVNFGAAATGGSPTGPYLGPVLDRFEAAGDRRYVGGDFTSIAGVAANNVACWDGVTWSALGSGMNGPVHALAVFDDGTGPSLYAGGAFTTAGGLPADNLAKWNGSAWRPVERGVRSQVCTPVVRALAVHDDGTGPALYVGGTFDHAGGSPGVAAFGLARWNGSTWSAVGGGLYSATDPGGCSGLPPGGLFPGAVDALRVIDLGTSTELCIGGRFDGAFAAPSVLSNLAKWNGTMLVPIGSGVDGRVRSLTSIVTPSSSMLVAGGDFLSAGGASAPHVAWCDPTVGAWASLGTGTNAAVRSLAVFDEGEGPLVYAGGDFTAAGGATVGHVAKWDGSAWSATGVSVSGTVSGLHVGEDQESSSEEIAITGPLDPLSSSSMVGLRPCCPLIWITQQPVHVLGATQGGSYTLSVAASGGALTYQWTKNGVDIPGATGSSYTVTSATFADGGIYTVVIKNGCRCKVSKPAYLVFGCALAFSSPAGPGSLQMDNGPCPALAGMNYLTAITLVPGSYPNGWFFGVDISFQELMGEFSSGYPFVGTLDATGASTFGPIGPGSLPPGLQLWAVTAHLTPGFGAILGARPAVTYTVP